MKTVERILKHWRFCDSASLPRLPFSWSPCKESTNHPNKCNIKCDFVSSYPSDLGRNLKTHSGEKSNKCNLCLSPRLPFSLSPCKEFSNHSTFLPSWNNFSSDWKVSQLQPFCHFWKDCQTDDKRGNLVPIEFYQICFEGNPFLSHHQCHNQISVNITEGRGENLPNCQTWQIFKHAKLSDRCSWGWLRL